MFHSHDGWQWERQEDGSVQIRAGENGPVHAVDANSWASIVASVSADGEESDTFNAALKFHMGDGEDEAPEEETE